MEAFQKKKTNISCVMFFTYWISAESIAADAVNVDKVNLNISEPFINLKTNDTLYIKCSGTPPLDWRYVKPMGTLHIQEIPSTTDYDVSVSSNGNESIIRLTFTSQEETGRYLCYHSQYNESIYIFVDDGKKLLLPIYDMYIPYIMFYFGVPDVIPCLPTVSEANVTLWKIKSSSNEAVPLEFEPTKGFTVKNPTDYFQKSFMCIANYKDRMSSIHLNLETIRETESIPQVYINKANAEYVLVGQTFRLECIVQAEINTMIKITWNYPVKDAHRVIHKVRAPKKSSAYQNVTEELKILNARKSDEGYYQCNATDHSEKQNYAEIYVRIFEKPQTPKVYFKESMEEVIKNRKETVELIASYKVFPPSSDIRAMWTKDKKPIVSGFEKHFVKNRASAFVLEISDLNWRDSGLYNVTVNAPGGRSEKSFFLRVKDKPIVNIQNSSCCYSPGQNYVLLCEIIGFPIPRNSWHWKPYCLNFTSNCNASSESIPWKPIEKYHTVNNSTVTEKHESDKIFLSLSVVAEKSGYYKCISENNFGKDEEKIRFVVTDVENGFEIICDNSFPEVKNDFSATCRASLILYTQLIWRWIPMSQNESLIIHTGPKAYSNESHSISLQLEFKEITKNRSGTYICEARLRNGGSFEEKSLFVEVRDHIEAVSGIVSGLDLPRILFPVCIGIALIILISIYITRCFCSKKKRLDMQNGFDRQLFTEGRMGLFNPNAPLDEQIDLLPYDEKWEFPKEKLKLGRTVGQGAFGRVVKAEAFEINDYEPSTIVAVKMLKERADSNQQKALMDELKILIHLGHHVNIVNLIGAVTKNIRKGELLVIVEYCRYGNLRHYLHRHRDNFMNEIDPETGRIISVFDPFVTDDAVGQSFSSEPFCHSVSSSSGVFAVDNPSYSQTRSKNIVCNNPRGSTSSHTIMYSTSGSSGSGSVFRNYYRADSQEQIITTSDLICYTFQCARGMDYLASRKLIHRDLAARNVLLAHDKIVKICDFGLAKDCYKYSNYIKKGDGPLPIKWMAIESIWDHIFTTKSDVWSFGILMWEFFTLGGNPYPGIDIDEEFYKKLKAGYRMEKPDLCPDFVYQLMSECWNANPDERPNFSQISDTLGNFLEDGVKQHYIDLNEPYLEMNRKLKSPEYFNVTSPEDDEQRIYVNSEVSNDVPKYDVPRVNRSISNASFPKEPMEVVPMIQLDTIPESLNEINNVNKTLELLQVNQLHKPDYLQMRKPLYISSE